jgi:Protein of unknown function (DUF1822)
MVAQTSSDNPMSQPVAPVSHQPLPFAFAIPLTRSLRKLARDEADRLGEPTTTPESCSLIYQQQLARLAAQRYFELFDIDAEMPSNDRNRLQLPEFSGQLECCPIAPGSTNMAIHPILDAHSLGHLAIELADHEAYLRGFIPKADQQLVALTRLQSLDQLHEHLYNQCVAVRLRKWLSHCFESSWQAIEDLSVQRPAMSFRSRAIPGQAANPVDRLPENLGNIQRRTQQLYDAQQLTQPESLNDSGSIVVALSNLVAQTADEETRWQAADLLMNQDPKHEATGLRRFSDLGLRLGGHAVALMVGILPRPDGLLSVLLRLYPMGEKSALPKNLSLAVSDDDGQYIEAVSRDYDGCIQLKFGAAIDEHFSVRVSLGEASLVEHFVA